MFTKEEASRIRSEFWTSFGQYMKPVPGADGEAVNWLNYKTGVKHLHFRLDADAEHASIGIEISLPDPEERELLLEKFRSVEGLLQQEMGEEWHWLSDTMDEAGGRLARIFNELDEVNIYRRSDWPSIISFLKQRLIALDSFWSSARDLFV